jgi:hypothetical protein
MSDAGVIVCLYLLVMAGAGVFCALWRRNNGGF